MSIRVLFWAKLTLADTIKIYTHIFTKARIGISNITNFTLKSTPTVLFLYLTDEPFHTFL